MAGWPIEPCPSNHEHPMEAEPCGEFRSQGFGPEGDYEHSLFCRVCGWEFGEHGARMPWGCTEEQYNDLFHVGECAACKAN